MNTRPTEKKPLVGVSQCLMGDAVRYDGQSKANRIVIEELAQVFELFPVCPEVEAGLPIPRPPVQLTGELKKPRLTGRDDNTIDVTDIMLTYCKARPAELNQLSGFIFKSRSPSCGLNSTPVFTDGQRITEAGHGIFASHLCKLYPHLPVIEDEELDDSAALEIFIEDVTNISTSSNHSR